MHKIREIKAYYLGIYYYPHSQTQVGAHFEGVGLEGGSETNAAGYQKTVQTHVNFSKEAVCHQYCDAQLKDQSILQHLLNTQPCLSSGTIL